MTEAKTVFFREWLDRGPAEDRSIARAGLLADRLGLLDLPLPVLTIVGSKGKGTAATYASAYLSAAGLRVVTVTSPSYRNDRERIRVNGQAIPPSDLADLAALLAARLPLLPARDGYLSPVGLFTLAGLAYAQRVKADTVVLEAGMGGRSDEVSLFPPTVLGITEIFEEHLGQIGPDLAAIAADKAGVVSDQTRAVLTLPQTAKVRHTLTETIAARSGSRLRPETVTTRSSGVPVTLLAPGINRANSVLGIAAAQRLLDVIAHPRPHDPAPALESVRIPGRASLHRVPGTEVIADSAINRSGIAAALAAAHRRWSGVDHVLLCLPDHKDLPGAVAELGDLPVTFVRLPDRHLRFDRPLPAGWQVIDAAGLTLDGLGPRVLALGTVYFIGRVLDLVNADTESLFTTE